jgi:hypothetical protein
MGDAATILDEVLPHYDVTLDETLAVGTDPAMVYRAARDLDFLSVRTPLLVASLWARSLPDRLRGTASEAPRELRLTGEGPGLPGWVVLGERPDDEIAFGAVGRFWQGPIAWRDVDPADFAGFAEPGWGKIAASFSVRPYGVGRTLLTYGCRTATTDERSRIRFGRYWLVVRPFVRHIMRATLRTIDAHAEGACAVRV